MPVSEKQKAYVRKHQEEKTDTVTVRPPKGTKDTWRKAANAKGISLQRFIINSVNHAVASALSENKNDSKE